MNSDRAHKIRRKRSSQQSQKQQPTTTTIFKAKENTNQNRIQLAMHNME